MRVGYHAAHEQFAPSVLLEHLRNAERAGFESAMCSDHFMPWLPEQGQSGFAWSWLGAALASSGLRMGVVTAPGWRYHPAVIAQAAATLAEMFPGRFWMALGSGEALNEHIVGERWPPKEERNARLAESADVIRRLLAGETVSHDGRIRVDRARILTRPTSAPPVYAAALSPETAAWAAGWADGLITASQPRERLARVVDAFRSAGGQGKPLVLQAQVSYAASQAEAERAALREWRMSAFDGSVLWNLEMPEQFDAAARHVRVEDLRDPVLMSSDVEAHVLALRTWAELGFRETLVHNVGRNQEEFVRVYGEQVLPAFRADAPTGRAGAR